MKVSLNDAVNGAYELTEDDVQEIEIVVSRGRSRKIRWAIYTSLKNAQGLRPNPLYERVIKNKLGKWQYVAESDHQVGIAAVRAALYHEFEIYLKSLSGPEN